MRFGYDADGNRVKRTDASGTTYYAGGGTFELWVPATTTLNSTVTVVSPLNQFPWRSYPVGTLTTTVTFVYRDPPGNRAD